jgi:hypothetical protein
MHLTGTLMSALFVLLLVIAHRRTTRHVKAERRHMLDECLPLLDRHRIVQHGVGFPVLTGTYGAHRVRIEPLVEQVEFRKVPSLLLLVTVRHEMALPGSLDLLARARNVEFYSPACMLPVRIDAPDAWPRDALLKVDDPAVCTLLPVLEPHVEALFEDPFTKELTITRHGVRIVYQAASACRGNYLMLRTAIFPRLGIGPALLRQLLDTGVHVCSDLSARTSCGV